MKQAIFSIAAFLFTILFVSCKKDNDVTPVPSNSMAGTYKGQYGYFDYQERYFYSFKLSAAGGLQEVNAYGVIVGEGTYTMNGTTFKATYKSLGSAGKMYSLVATYDAATKKLTGTWGKEDKVDSGQWFMYKQ